MDLMKIKRFLLFQINTNYIVCNNLKNWALAILEYDSIMSL